MRHTHHHSSHPRIAPGPPEAHLAADILCCGSAERQLCSGVSWLQQGLLQRGKGEGQAGEGEGNAVGQIIRI